MIFFLIFLVVLALILQGRMGPWALKQLSCDLRCGRYLVEPGESFPITVTLQNRSFLPILFLTCRFSVPVSTQLREDARGQIVRLTHSAEYKFSCFLLPRQTLQHTAELMIPNRGGYLFSDVRLDTGDLFGLEESEARFPGECEVVILPRKPDRSKAPQVAGGVLGQRSVMRWIHEDPILSAGFREYTGREPLKTVSWNRSLQSGRLMVRQMDHTAEEKVTVLFSLDLVKWDDCEDYFSLCRGVCEALEAQKVPFAFLHNGLLRTQVGILPAVEEGMGRNHLNRILEGLGRAAPYSRESLTTLIRKSLLRSQDSSCYLLLVPSVTPDARRAAAHLQSVSGRPVELIGGDRV